MDAAQFLKSRRGRVDLCKFDALTLDSKKDVCIHD